MTESTQRSSRKGNKYRCQFWCQFAVLSVRFDVAVDYTPTAWSLSDPILAPSARFTFASTW
jgi:hypothetical protein